MASTSLLEGDGPIAQLTPLLTRSELEVSEETTEFFIAEIPSRMGDAILKQMAEALPASSGPQYQHMRRFVRPENMPAVLKSVLPPVRKRRSGYRRRRKPNSRRPMSELPTDVQTVSVDQVLEKPPNPLYCVVCRTDAITEEELQALFSSNPSIVESKYEFRIYTTQIPIKPPVSPEQAAVLTERYWPVLYRPGNTYGPPKASVQKSQAIIAPSAAQYMKLARDAARAVEKEGYGEAVGAVIVSYDGEGKHKVLALAGDARWCQTPRTADSSCGNVMAHAVVRAIGMVGRRRVNANHRSPELQEKSIEVERRLVELEDKTNEQVKPLNPKSSLVVLPKSMERPLMPRFQTGLPHDFFLDQPITSIEKEYTNQSEPSADSYLCLGHTIFVTHEPCVMCSMALIHSRFERVIFGHRLPGRGGLTSEHAAENETDDDAPPSIEEGLGYGLFYRSELNWKLFAWELKDENDEPVELRSTVYA